MGGRSQSPNVTWVRNVAAVETQIPVASKALLAALVPSTSFDETIRRTNIRLMIRSDQSAAQELQVGAFGARVVSDLAIAAGAASIPGPSTDSDDDGWFVWFPISQTGEIPTDEANASAIYEVSSRAMRTLVEGEQVAFMIENASAANVFNAHLAFSLISSLKR